MFPEHPAQPLSDDIFRGQLLARLIRGLCLVIKIQILEVMPDKQIGNAVKFDRHILIQKNLIQLLFQKIKKFTPQWIGWLADKFSGRHIRKFNVFVAFLICLLGIQRRGMKHICPVDQLEIKENPRMADGFQPFPERQLPPFFQYSFRWFIP